MDKGINSKIYKNNSSYNSTTTTNQPNQKMGIRPKYTFLQITHTDGQEVHGKMLNSANY